MNKNVIYVFSFLLLSLVFEVNGANAIKKEITFTGHPDYIPVSFAKSDSGEIVGVMPDLLNMALSELGYVGRSVSTGTWARAQEEVKKGRVDILIPPYRTNEREEWLYFQNSPILMDETAIFVLKNNTKFDNYKNFQDLKNYHGVALINDSFGDEFDRFYKEVLKLQRLKTTEQCFKFLSKGRADFLVAGLHAGNNVLKQHNMGSVFKIIPKRIIVTGMYIGFSKKSTNLDQALIDKLNKKLVELIDRGAIQDLMKKY